MKHLLYTCLRCKKQTTMPPDHATSADANGPTEWAKIYYERWHTQQEGEQAGGMVRTTLETHACGDCAKDVLDYLEPPAKTALLESA